MRQLAALFQTMPIVVKSTVCERWRAKPWLTMIVTCMKGEWWRRVLANVRRWNIVWVRTTVTSSSRQTLIDVNRPAMIYVHVCVQHVHDVYRRLEVCKGLQLLIDMWRKHSYLGRCQFLLSCQTSALMASSPANIETSASRTQQYQANYESLQSGMPPPFVYNVQSDRGAHRGT